MNAGLLVGGIFLMVLGAAMYLYVQTALSECASFIGQLGQMFSSDSAQQCQIANYVQLGGGVSFVIGLGLTIGGAVSSGEKRATFLQYICGYCNYIAETERELYNHSLICEKKKQDEESKSKNS